MRSQKIAILSTLTIILDFLTISVIYVLVSGATLGLEVIDQARILNIVTTALVTALETQFHSEKAALPRQGGQRITYEWLNSLSDKEGRYRFQCVSFMNPRSTLLMETV
jgi:hypothetical protein